MSRKKGSVKKENLQGKTLEEKIEAARFGENHHAEIRQLFTFLKHAEEIKSANFKHPPARRSAKKHLAQGWSKITGKLLEAVANNDAAFFRAFADVIETQGKSVDPILEYLGIQFAASEALGQPPRSVKSLAESLIKIGLYKVPPNKFEFTPEDLQANAEALVKTHKRYLEIPKGKPGRPSNG